METKTELKSGSFYTVIDGQLQEIERDPEDTLRKVRLMEEAFTSATELQKSLRKHLNGYKPDLTLVCSALIAKYAQDDEAVKTVVQYFQSITMKIAEEL